MRGTKSKASHELPTALMAAARPGEPAMSFAIVFNDTVVTHTSRNEALHNFGQVVRRCAGAKLFAVAAGGRAFTDITPAVLHAEVAYA